MTFAEPLPLWALALAVVVIGAISWRAGWQAGAQAGPPAPPRYRIALVALRALALLALLAIFMRPVRLAPDPAARGLFAVLVDVSRSMALSDADGGSRLQAAEQVVRNSILPAVSDRFAVDVIAFGEDVKSVPPERLSDLRPTAPATDVTRAIEALRRRAAAQPLVGAIVVSDGGFTLPDDDGTKTLNAPVYTLGVGGSVVGRDLEVRQITAGDATVAGATIDLTATILSTGFGNTPTEVRVTANGRPLEVRRVTPAGEGIPAEVLFKVAPGAETATLYTIEALPQPGELTSENNRRALLVPPPGRPRRVLLIEGAPGFEHSFLKRALDQDKGLQLDAVVRKGPNDAGEETFYVQAARDRGPALTGGFPASRRNLFTYDAVVLANVATDLLSRDQLSLLAEYVGERGGGLLVLGSRSLDPAAVTGTVLEELLPVEISDRRAPGVARAELGGRLGSGVTLTVDGERHPVMRLGAGGEETRERWAKMPPLAAVASVGGARPGATVLALTGGRDGVARPLVAVQRYGRGRVMTFAGEAAWRWRMMLPSTDTTYPTFWRQATRWLAGASPEPIMVTTTSPAPDRLAIAVDVRDENFKVARDADVRLTIRGADGSQQTVKADVDRESSLFRAEARVPGGVTRIETEATVHGTPLGRATAWALAGADDAELVEPRRNDAQLTRLAGRYGGSLIGGDGVAKMVRDLGVRQRPGAALIERDIWQSPWILLAVALLLISEWALRRRWGLR